MTREEAITTLKEMHESFDEIHENTNGGIGYEQMTALDMAIEEIQEEPTKAVPPSLADVYKWERDVALSQLEEYGIGFAEKKRDDLVEVVRCKDCIHYESDDSGEMMVCNVTDTVCDNDDFCSYGERREGGEA